MHHFEAHELADSWELRAGLLDADPADASISACLRECAAALRAAAVPDVQPKHTALTDDQINAAAEEIDTEPAFVAGYWHGYKAGDQSPAPAPEKPLPAELGEWLTAIGELYIVMGRPKFEATEPTLGVVETLREAAKRLAAASPAPVAGLVMAPSDKVVWRLIDDAQKAEGLAESVALNAAMKRAVDAALAKCSAASCAAVGVGGVREVLEELEWSGTGAKSSYGSPEPCCPCCEEFQHDGHAKRCKLGAALKVLSTPAPAVVDGQDERAAFEAVVAKEAGPGATKRWLGTDAYENHRINDNRMGWVWCLEWLKRTGFYVPVQPMGGSDV